MFFKEITDRTSMDAAKAYQVAENIAFTIMGSDDKFTMRKPKFGFGFILEYEWEHYFDTKILVSIDYNRRWKRGIGRIKCVEIMMEAQDGDWRKKVYKGTYKADLDGKWNEKGFMKKLNENKEYVIAGIQRQVEQQKRNEEAKDRKEALMVEMESELGIDLKPESDVGFRGRINKDVRKYSGRVNGKVVEFKFNNDDKIVITNLEGITRGQLKAILKLLVEG